MGLGELSPWHLLILAAVILVLFGAKKLPDSARSLGRAMRIFKAETAGLRGDGDRPDDGQSQASAPAQQLPAAAPVQAPAQTSGDSNGTAVNTTAVNGAAVPEAQRTNQPG